MRPLLPLFCVVAAGLALSSVSLAEDTFVIKSVTVDTREGALQPPPAEAAPAVATEVVALKAAAPEPAADLAPAVDPDQKKAEILRGSLFMMILPNLCCRY